ncbi:uncharacterized protein LOC105255896 [Camponotus floridanus]|nr:uncharacterized protein LOC105255896 [Camponotus floridanus]XP_025270537.1 uncharacterized protein LOC105255896 [Camponotus floridanus]XP_025270538.1 uncharacterized protein LOC105255896 [Camponotus floridanus]
MWMQMLKIVVVLLVAGSGDTRPQKSDDVNLAPQAESSDAGWKDVQAWNKTHDTIRDDSSEQLNITRDLKDLQYMDQSLRTVATQLLNVTNSQDVIKVHNKDFTTVEHGIATTLKSSEKNDTSSLIKEVNSEIGNLESTGLIFGRPINSKFSYFENSHPGQAMAMTQEELEREMSSTRLMTAYKNNPTTTGGISTWILLNPPSTTVKSAEVEKIKLQQPFQTEVRLTVRPSSSIDRVETISQSDKTSEKSTPQLTPIITTEKITVITKKPTTTITKKITTTQRPEKATSDSELESSSGTTLKAVRTTTLSSLASNETTFWTTISTTKKNQRTTSKPKITTSRTTSHSKPITTKPTRSGQQGRPKPTTTRRTTVKFETIKNETSASTGKIEKVTFKPVQIITTPQNKPENTEKPIFVTKIKASVFMDNQKSPTTLLPTSAITTPASDIASKTELFGIDLVEVPVKSKPTGTKVNNVLKVQLKKPAEETTQIEIEPIKVNAPVLKIEKIDKNKMEQIVDKDTDNLSSSKIDLQFDFNPELTKINVETQTQMEVTSTTTTATSTSTTTKRPRHNSKRKKNKVRRRKPSTTSAAPSPTTVATIVSTLMETGEGTTNDIFLDNAIQESKIAPETKIANATKNKKKQPQKAISTQIYNFLSRDVMPSFGVMSLVGLGLGLASYFLYPFGGTISRRNYDVEPNYKYNLDEYGGNYGQSEEEVLSKVFQGMTNHESKYPGVKDSNYYHYQHYDGAYDTQTTKKTDARYPSISTSPIYRTMENTQPAVKYRNTDFRYTETQTTPIYYDHKRLDVVEAAGSANRQFVVGNVPKEYPFDVKAAVLPIDSKNGVNYVSTEIGQTQFERDIAQGFNFPPNSAEVYNYQVEASTVRSDDGYEEIEITPTAVAVEHGPRSLKVKRSVGTSEDDQRSRLKRDSVIQVIPSKHELEEEREEAEKEEDLSNEILDIIDSALPGGEQQKTKNNSEENEVEDFKGQKKRQQEEVNTRAKESTMRTLTTVKNMEKDTTNSPESVTSSPKIVEPMNDGGSSTSSSEISSDRGTSEIHFATTSNPKTSEATTVEWFESSTTKKPPEGFSIFNFVKKVAEIKFRLGLTILKHASEGFARYLGHVQKRINGEE